MSNKLTNEIFIQRAKEVHGDKYDYSSIKYVDYHTPVLINCFKHGLFLQSPAEHLNGKGCKKCGYETVSKSLKSNAEIFIEKAKSIHGDKYDYSLVDYKNSKTKVKIICKKCGNIFEQTPDKHLKRNGCPNCRFMNPKNEAIIFDWLKLNNYLFERNKKFKDLKDKKLLSYDFYIPSKKIVNWIYWNKANAAILITGYDRDDCLKLPKEEFELCKKVAIEIQKEFIKDPDYRKLNMQRKIEQEAQSQKENKGKVLTKQQLENTVGKDMAHRLTHLDNEKTGTRFPVHVMKSINQATHRPDLYEEVNYFDY